MNQPLGKTTFGVTVWAVPGREPGQQTGLEHLTWGGPGDTVHRHTRGIARDGMEYPGPAAGTVSGPCQDDAEAQHAVDTYIAARFPGHSHPGPQQHAQAADATGEQIAEVAGEPAAPPAGASASAGPCTVTGYFATSVGPTLHYTLASAAGEVLDYSRSPDGTVAVQVQAGNHWTGLDAQDHRYQAVIRGVREHEARNPDLAGYNNPHAASTGGTRVPAVIAFSQLRDFERIAPDGNPAIAKFRRWQQLQPGQVIAGQRDPWAVVTHVTWSGPEVVIRVQEAGGSRTITSRTPGPSIEVRADLRVDPSTCLDIPDGFPPRWGVWRSGPGRGAETEWFSEPGEAARQARQASRDGGEYVVELEAPDGSWTQVDAYQQGRRSAWGVRLAAGEGKTAVPPWATPAPGLPSRPAIGPARRPRRPAGPGSRVSRGR